MRAAVHPSCRLWVSFNDYISSSVWIVFSSFFACLVIFYWMPGIVHHTLVGARYFCSPINSFDFVLGCSNFILSGLQDLFSEMKAVFNRADYFPLLTQDLSTLSINYEVFQFDWWE